MDALLLPYSGIGLMLLLGLRHGFDPDHIAIIDSMAYRVASERPALAAWTGTLFALGHGLAVTAIAVGLAQWVGDVAMPHGVHLVLDWLPTLLLLMVGTLNLRSLLGTAQFRPIGWKSRFLPRRLHDSSHPLAITLVGVLFALVFDTATQAAAWGYAATSSSGTLAALFAGLAFTVGMMITDTVDGHLVVRLMRHTASRGNVALYRRTIGWLVVFMSYGIAAYEIVLHVHPGLEMSDFSMSIIGCALVAAMAFAYAVSLWRRRALTQRMEHAQ
ncbi:MAG: nickel permease [Pseudomonadota bacterium]|nr:nickel permease [Pseudomonadota bacterium]